MRKLPSMHETWVNGDFTGPKRPIARVTIERPMMKLHNFNLETTYSIRDRKTSKLAASYNEGTYYDTTRGMKIQQTYANYLFNTPSDPKEIPGIKSVAWSRSRDQDIADCTITLANNKQLEFGDQKIANVINQPGYYTPTYGQSVYAQNWGHISNEWSGVIMPDNIIKTYEGYGCNPEVCPEKDDNLVITGVWIIDSVVFNAFGELTIKCRDTARLLADHYVYKPVVPQHFYPLYFEKWPTDKVYLGEKTSKKKKVGSRKKLKISFDTSSDCFYNPTGYVHGHKSADAIDGDPATYSMSVGNIAPSRRFAFSYIQVKTKGDVSEVKFRTKKSGYKAYVSVYADGVWQGSQTIPYHQDGVGITDANKKYVKAQKVTDEGWQVINFPTIEGATKVRLTLGNLQYFQFGPYHYRGCIREMQVFHDTSGKKRKNKKKYGVLPPGPEGSNPNTVQDYTNIIKLLLAWGGFFWPNNSIWKNCDSTTLDRSFNEDDDDVLGHGVGGRVWGDFQDTGTAPEYILGQEQFDKQSLLDCISKIKTDLGFHGGVDETGGYVWRLPNVYEIGNWTSEGRVDEMYTLDEHTVLLDYGVTMDSSNVREKIVISDPIGKYSSTAAGYNPNPTGLRRVAIWTDKGFDSEEMTQVMADMAALRALFDYRTGQSIISGFPGIQIDDQVRIKEKTTEESYVHYIRGISSNLDMLSGEYRMTVEHNWLGSQEDDKWLFHPGRNMSPDAQFFIGEPTQEPVDDWRPF